MLQPAQRARETAAAIGAAQDLTATVVDGFAELHVRNMVGASSMEVDAYFAAAARRSEHWDGFRVRGSTFHAICRHRQRLEHYDVHTAEVDAFTGGRRRPARNVAHRDRRAWRRQRRDVATCSVSHRCRGWIRFETPLAAYSVVALRAINDQVTFGRYSSSPGAGPRRGS
jgi:hypothetical protein